MSAQDESDDSQDTAHKDTSAGVGKRSKRRKIEPKGDASSISLNVSPLLHVLKESLQLPGDHSFDTLIADVLPEILRELDEVRWRGGDLDPVRRGDTPNIMEQLLCEGEDRTRTILMSLIVRKLTVHPSTLRLLAMQNASIHTPEVVSPVPPTRPGPNVNHQTLEALYAIQTTPYENSFLSRILGLHSTLNSRAVAVDWETRSPWMELTSDIREHYLLMHPERDVPPHISAPIEYVNLQAEHIPQVHDILRRTFWDGIDVSDALLYSPDKCTIIATYKKLVVGVAFLSSPQETYITYLAVRAGWENAQIATTMLYHLITLNPHKDITLHVSINNPAMLLYNRFGFKAEEFIVGFYEDYLDPQSRASKNAFRLRLRR